jgi:hypothetical protein
LSNNFDLALNLLCNEQKLRGVEEYSATIAKLEQEQPLRRRGLLFVALDDLGVRMGEQAGLAQEPAFGQAFDILKVAFERSLQDIPRVIPGVNIETTQNWPASIASLPPPRAR